MPPRPPNRQKFLTGSILQHVAVMAGTGAIGLVAVFVVDLLNLFYISLLRDRSLTAAVGFYAVVNFFLISVSIGLTIGVGAVVSRTLGAGQFGRAKRVATSSLCVMFAIMAVLAALMLGLLQPVLAALGATGEVRAQAWRFLAVSMPSVPLMSLGMVSGALLRSVGDARRSMNISLAGALATAALDPVLILLLHLGLLGAAISVVVSRCVMAGLGLRWAAWHSLLGRPDWRRLLSDARQVGGVAMPAVLTNLATPVGGAYVTHALAQFGPAAVAGEAVVDRIVPVAFGFIFALSGSVGPIMAQNLGAGQFGRVRQVLRGSLLLVSGCVLVVWALMFLAQNWIVAIFGVTGTAEQLVRLFCNYTAPSMLFVGLLFVANAGFNNLGRPVMATVFNWARATLGTLPFVSYGMRYGPVGAIVGYSLGGVLFGALAGATAFWVTSRLRAPAGQGGGAAVQVAAISGKAAMAEMAQAGEAGE